MEASAAVDGGSYTTVSVASVAAPCTGGGSVFAGTEESNVRWASTCVDDKPPLGTGRALQTAAAVELAEAATTVVVGRGMEPVVAVVAVKAVPPMVCVAWPTHSRLFHIPTGRVGARPEVGAREWMPIARRGSHCSTTAPFHASLKPEVRTRTRTLGMHVAVRKAPCASLFLAKPPSTPTHSSKGRFWSAEAAFQMSTSSRRPCLLFSLLAAALAVSSWDFIGRAAPHTTTLSRVGTGEEGVCLEQKVGP